MLASDYAKEQRWADQIVDSLIDGDAVWLEANENDFLGIYTRAEENKNRAVIILHGTGVHPDWAQVVHPLRVLLLDYDWHTLSIQMPVLPNNAMLPSYAPLYEEVAPRVTAAIEFLKKNDVKQIVLIGHSLGASMGAYYMTNNNPEISGFIGIGMVSGGIDPRMNDGISISKITSTPILDIYGSKDLKGVLNTKQLRSDAAKKSGNPNYQQKIIEGANHFFDGKEEELVSAISLWMEALKKRK